MQTPVHVVRQSELLLAKISTAVFPTCHTRVSALLWLGLCEIRISRSGGRVVGKVHALIVAFPAVLNHVIERRAWFPIQSVITTNPGETFARRIRCERFEQPVV